MTGLSGSMWAPRPNASSSSGSSKPKTTTTTSGPDPASAQQQHHHNHHHPHHPHHHHQQQQQQPSSLATPPPPRSTTAITPAVPAPPASLSTQPLPAQELERYGKIIGRISWKIPALDFGYFNATAAISRYAAGEIPAWEVSHQVTMFKLDFYEFYMLIERALVHLLGVFGVAVTGQWRRRAVGMGGSSADSGEASGDGAKDASANRDGPRSTRYPHAYHQNIIDSLEDESIPLHHALGSKAVDGALQRAKDLRNLWKYAESDDGNNTSNGNGGNKNVTAAGDPHSMAAVLSLDKLDLRSMLETILIGLMTARGMAETRVQAMIKAGETAPAQASETWDFYSDAMDWEAI